MHADTMTQICFILTGSDPYCRCAGRSWLRCATAACSLWMKPPSRPTWSALRCVSMFLGSFSNMMTFAAEHGHSASTAQLLYIA